MASRMKSRKRGERETKEKMVYTELERLGVSTEKLFTGGAQRNDAIAD